MALPSVTSLKNDILALTPSDNIFSAIPPFVAAIANWTNNLQAGSMGSPGILTFGNAAMEAILETQTPVADNSWIVPFGNAWEQGILTSIITPGTVTNPIWLYSVTDTLTVPSAAATITTIAAAKAQLISDLANVVPDATAPLALAQAIDSATRLLSFTCIGLGNPNIPPPTPIPIPYLAE